MQHIFGLSCILRLSTALALSQALAAQAEFTIPGTVVRATVSRPGQDLSLRSASLSRDGATSELVLSASGGLMLASVSGQGVVDLRSQILPSKSPNANLAAGRLFSLQSGQRLMFSTPGEGPLSLYHLSSTGQPSALKRLDWQTDELYIRRITSPASNRLRLLGEVSSRPVIVDIDAEGKLLNQTFVSNESMSILAAAALPDGANAVALEKGTPPFFTTIVGIAQPSGKLNSQVTFPGRPLDFARGSDGSYLLILEAAVNGLYEVTIKGLRSDLTTAWERPISKTPRMSTGFRAAALASGGFIVAGVKDRGLWVSRINSAGTSVWLETHDPSRSAEMELTLGTELVSSGNSFLVAYSAYIVENRTQRQVVRTIRFEVQP